jgi:hypothetical protein
LNTIAAPDAVAFPQADQRSKPTEPIGVFAAGT